MALSFSFSKTKNKYNVLSTKSTDLNSLPFIFYINTGNTFSEIMSLFSLFFIDSLVKRDIISTKVISENYYLLPS